MSVANCQQCVSAAEFTDWLAYDQLSPIDAAHRLENSIAVVAATVANVNRGKKTPLAFDKFKVSYRSQRGKTPDELWQAARRATMMLGGTFRVRGDEWET